MKIYKYHDGEVYHFEVDESGGVVHVGSFVPGFHMVPVSEAALTPEAALDKAEAQAENLIAEMVFAIESLKSEIKKIQSLR